MSKLIVSKRFVSYLRCPPTSRAVEAQRGVVRRNLFRHYGEQITQFVEVEGGKRSDRPQLAAAMALAKGRTATLLVAKPYRLSRNVAFIAALMERKDGDQVQRSTSWPPSPKPSAT